MHCLSSTLSWSTTTTTTTTTTVQPTPCANRVHMLVVGGVAENVVAQQRAVRVLAFDASTFEVAWTSDSLIDLPSDKVKCPVHIHFNSDFVLLLLLKKFEFYVLQLCLLRHASAVLVNDVVWNVKNTDADANEDHQPTQTSRCDVSLVTVGGELQVNCCYCRCSV